MQIGISDYLLNAAVSWPDHAAVVDDERRLSYAQLLARACELGARIASAAPRPRTPVCVLMPKGCAAVVSIAAATLAGHLYVPLDANSPAARLQAIVGQLGEPLVVCLPGTHALADGLGVPAGRVLQLDPQPWAGQAVAATEVDGLARQARAMTAGVIDTDPCYVIFTSGSTGTPKGVTISHRSVIDYIEWARGEYPVGAQDRLASQAPFHFDNSTLDLYLTIATGATLFLPADKVYSFPALVLKYLAEHRITTVFWVPSVLVAVANSGLLEKNPPTTLKHVLFAGEQMPVPQINAWVRALPGVLFSNLYGPTEITVDCTAYTFREEFRADILPIGYACRNTDILVLDDENRACEAEQIGELCVRGSSLALGYWNDLERTNAVFVQNPLERRFSDLVYRTGDLVRRSAGGCITFLGRKDSQIKHNGYRIELGEIEAAAFALAGVAQACVLYPPSKRQIVLFVQFHPEAAKEVAVLRRQLAERIPKYMMPGIVKVLDEFPLNANGKVDRLALNQRLT